VEPCPVDCIDLLPTHGKLIPDTAPPTQEDALADETGTTAERRQRSEHWRRRYENRVARLARETSQRHGSRRRSVARPETPDIADDALQNFSRDQARVEIAAAVARVKARRQQQDRAPSNHATVNRKDP